VPLLSFPPGEESLPRNIAMISKDRRMTLTFESIAKYSFLFSVGECSPLKFPVRPACPKANGSVLQFKISIELYILKKKEKKK
jgi:hypothetical protein